MQLVMWRAIQEAKTDGMLEFDMGRTEWSNVGLLTFKDRWGATRSSLRYHRHPVRRHPGELNTAMRIARGMVALAPDPLFISAGSIFYRHFA